MFRDMDLDGDGFIDLNEWMISLRLHSKLLAELSR